MCWRPPCNSSVIIIPILQLEEELRAYWGGGGGKPTLSTLLPPPFQYTGRGALAMLSGHNWGRGEGSPLWFHPPAFDTNSCATYSLATSSTWDRGEERKKRAPPPHFQNIVGTLTRLSESCLKLLGGGGKGGRCSQQNRDASRNLESFSTNPGGEWAGRGCFSSPPYAPLSIFHLG